MKKALSLLAALTLALTAAFATVAPASAMPSNTHPSKLTAAQYKSNCLKYKVSCYWQENRWSWGSVWYKCADKFCNTYTGSSRPYFPNVTGNFKYSVVRYRL